MSKDIMVNQLASAFYVPQSAVAISTNAKFAKQPITNEVRTETGEWVSWGDNDDYPQQLIKNAEKNSTIPAVIDKKGYLLYGGGLSYGVEKVENGKLIREPLKIAAIDDFNEASNIDTYLQEAAHDRYFFVNNFIQFDRAIGKGMPIKCLSSIDASMCRFDKPTANGIFNQLLVHGDFGSGVTVSKKDALKFPAINPKFKIADQIIQSKSPSLVLPIRPLVRGRVTYAKPSWTSVIESGWVDVANAIPAFKKALMENQMSIKYHVQIDEGYWPNKFKDWNKKTEAEQIQCRIDEVDNFVKFMKSPENAGNAWITNMKAFNDGKHLSYFKIDKIDTNEQGGEYIEDSQEADFHIVRALGLHPSLMGVGPGKNMGGGSGSDIRVAFNMHQLTSKPDADALLQPLQIAATVNNWHSLVPNNAAGDFRLKFWLNPLLINTLDKGAEVQNQNS